MEFTYNGARMYYEAHGEGASTLVLLHGWGASGENWLPVARDFSAEYRVLTVDFPGFRHSPEPDRAWGVGDYVELTAAFIREVAGGKCDVIAHSFGGRVALVLASAYPDLVNKLVLTGCAGLIPRLSLAQKIKRAAFRVITRAADNRLTRKLFGDGVIRNMRERARARFGSADYKNASPRMRETFIKVIEQDLDGCLAAIAAPTLLVWGEYDTATPLWMGKHMEARIPDAGLVVFEGAGHFAYLEMYPRFHIVARKFLLG